MKRKASKYTGFIFLIAICILKFKEYIWCTNTHFMDKNLIFDEYIQRRQKLISEVINAVKTRYPDDKDMVDLAIHYCTALEVADPAPQFIDDLLGFMMWQGMVWHGMTKGSETYGRAVSTILHDLREFMNNRHEDWFCPRTYGYRKYLTGASGVRV
jgi:hypothetical protein